MNYDALSPSGQRITDSLLWAAAALGTCIGLVFLFYVLNGLLVGAAVMAFAMMHPVLAVYLMRRGRTTAAIVQFTIGMALVLDGMVLLNGGIDSSVTHWFVLIPCLLVIVLRPRQKLVAIGAVVVHQLGALWLFSNVTLPEVPDLGVAALFIDTVLSTIVAALLGLTVSVSRGRMWHRMVCAENDLRTAMAPIQTEFLVIDRSRRLAVDPSGRMQGWLGSGRQGDDAVVCAAIHFPEFAEQLRRAFDELKRGDRSPESCFAMLPREHTDGTEQYECSYRLWAPREGTAWRYVVATLKNVTDAKTREDASLRREALAVLLRHSQNDLFDAQTRFSAAQAYMDELDRPMDAAQWAAWRNALQQLATDEELHTFARIVGGARYAAEPRVYQEGRRRIRVAWRHMSAILHSLERKQDEQGVRAPNDEYHTLLALLEQRAPLDAIDHHVASWQLGTQAPRAGT